MSFAYAQCLSFTRTPVPMPVPVPVPMPMPMPVPMLLPLPNPSYMTGFEHFQGAPPHSVDLYEHLPTAYPGWWNLYELQHVWAPRVLVLDGPHSALLCSVSQPDMGLCTQ